MQQDYLVVRKMQNGDEEAMELFVREYYPQILKYCRYHCPDRESAEDLTQETFARFFRNLSSYRHKGKALNYLYTIARNLCIDFMRKNRERTPGGYVPEEEMEHIRNSQSGGMSGAGYYDPGKADAGKEMGRIAGTDWIEERILIEEALRKLPDELREVVILHYFQELSLRETAAALQVGLPLVKYRIGKAKEKLREELL